MTDQPKFQASAPTSPGSLLRSEFDRLSPADRMRAMKERWVVTDDPPGSKPAPTITKQAFDRMPAVGQALFTARGGRISE